MFGAVCSGQPIQMLQQVDTLKYVINFPQLPQKISHMTIFMLPNIEFDPNYTAMVYFQINLPGKPVNSEFKLLGGLNLNKQSAIYKIRANNSASSANNSHPLANEMMLDDIDMDATLDMQEVIIGISIEPNAEAEMMLLSLRTQQQQQQQQQAGPLLLTNTLHLSTANVPVETKVKMSNKIIENCYNYLSSFEDMNKKVPIAKFNEWWKRYIQKLENNPKMLDDE